MRVLPLIAGFVPVLILLALLGDAAAQAANGLAFGHQAHKLEARRHQRDFVTETYEGYGYPPPYGPAPSTASDAISCKYRFPMLSKERAHNA